MRRLSTLLVTRLRQAGYTAHLLIHALYLIISVPIRFMVSKMDRMMLDDRQKGKAGKRQPERHIVSEKFDQ
jgi:hypothetical protein